MNHWTKSLHRILWAFLEELILFPTQCKLLCDTRLVKASLFFVVHLICPLYICASFSMSIPSSPCLHTMKPKKNFKQNTWALSATRTLPDPKQPLMNWPALSTNHSTLKMPRNIQFWVMQNLQDKVCLALCPLHPQDLIENIINTKHRHGSHLTPTHYQLKKCNQSMWDNALHLP